MYARSADELAEAKDLLDDEDVPDNFSERVELFLDREREWVLLHQLDVVNRCNNTNNFAEATIHILKDVILGRQTAFNTVAFVEFCTAVWEPYMIRRLLNVAHNRDARGRLVYSELMKRCDKLDVLAVTRLDDTYIVPSTKQRDVHCSV